MNKFQLIERKIKNYYYQTAKLAILCLLLFSLSGCEQSNETADKRPRVKNTSEVEQATSPTPQSPTSPISNTPSPTSPVSTATATPQPKAKPSIKQSTLPPPDNCITEGENNAPLRVRSVPGGNVIGSLNVGSDILAYDLVKDGSGVNWTKIKYKGGFGYVLTRFISCG